MPPSLRAPGRIPSHTAAFPSTTPQHHPTLFAKQQVRHATLIRRPHRPYTFTQLLTLSDGSTFVHRTTSPIPVYRSTRDTRNTPAWNPSNARLASVEEDEAGRLRAFRRRFGRAFDTAAASAPDAESPGAAETADADGESSADAASGAVSGAAKGAPAAAKTQDEAQPRGAGTGTTAESGEDDGENLMDLLSSYDEGNAQKTQGGSSARVVQRAGVAAGASGSGKGGKRRR